MQTEEILKQISKLSDDEREKLIDAILIKHGPPLKPETEPYSDMIKRRIEEVKSGKVKTIPRSVMQERRRKQRHESANS